jgi:hypothetical protein
MAAASSARDELLSWRLAGAAVWQSAAFCAGYTAWRVAAAVSLQAAPGAPLASLTGLSTLLLLCLLQLGVLLAKRMVLGACEAPPMFVPLLGLHGRSWPGVLLARTLLRSRRLQDLISVAALLAATMIGATATLYVSGSGVRTTTMSLLVFDAGYGAILGGLHTLLHLAKYVYCAMRAWTVQCVPHLAVRCDYILLSRSSHHDLRGLCPTARSHASKHCKHRHYPSIHNRSQQLLPLRHAFDQAIGQSVPLVGTTCTSLQVIIAAL